MKTGSFVCALLTLAVGASALALPEPDSKNGNCAASKKLAQGVDQNIKIQQQELRDLKDVERAIENGNQNQFRNAQKKLLNTIDQGVRVRENNQKIAPNNNSEVKNGLKTVQNAQSQERKQAESLRGDRKDLNTVQKLRQEFEGGIQKNEQNKQSALRDC